MDKEKYREANSDLGIENIRKGYRIFGSENFSFATALRVHDHDRIEQLFDSGLTNEEVAKEMDWPLRTIQDHRTKYYLCSRKKSDS